MTDVIIVRIFVTFVQNDRLNSFCVNIRKRYFNIFFFFLRVFETKLRIFFNNYLDSIEIENVCSVIRSSVETNADNIEFDD